MSEITDIRYFTDGEQATAAVLNRPAKDLAIVDSVMSKVQFEANAAARREQYAGSGFVEWGKIRTDHIPINDGMYAYRYNDHKKKSLFLGNQDDILPKINVNGNIITDYGRICQANWMRGEIEFPKVDTSVNTITDSTNAPAMKQGDFAILKDLDRELVSNGTFDSDDLSMWDTFYGTTHEVVNGQLKLSDPDTISYGVYVINVVVGVTYEIAFDAISDDAQFQYRIGVYGDSDYYINTTNADGTTSIRITATKNTLMFNPRSSSAGTIYCDNLSIKQVLDQPIVALKDINANVDIYENTDKFEARDSISRQDLVFLETWHENIADKDIVYPYGNIQYRGGNTDGLSGIADGTFTGAGTYSLFGNWQSENDLVGRGYKWSDLSLVDKVKFASNHDNNVYRDGNNWVQVRYRIRVVKGLGNEFLDTYGNGAVEPRVNFGYRQDYYVATKGSTVSIDSDLDSKKFFFCNSQSYCVDAVRGAFGRYAKDTGKTLDSLNALPIALIQRRNAGIWHAIYNPEGTAYPINSTNDGYLNIEEYAFDSNTITCLADCFDLAKIAAKDADGNIVTANATSAVVQTGLIESGLSARPDGIYADEVNERDVEDLRMSAHKKPYSEIMDEMRNKAIAAEVRGKEVSLINTAFKLDDRSTDGWSKSVFYSHNTNSINTVSIYTKALLDSKGHMLDSGSVIPFISRITFGEFSFPITYCDANQLEFDVTMFGYTETQIGKYIQNNITGTGKFDIHISHTKSFTYNNTLTHCDIIGDPRQIQDRVSITTVNGDDQTATINKNTYVKANDNYYRSLVDRGSITVDPDTEDYTNTDNWIDLGNDGTVGGYKQEWLDNGIAGTPLIVGEEGESLLPIDVGISNPNSSSYKLSKKITADRKCIVTKKDGTFVKYSFDSWSLTTNTSKKAYIDSHNNKIYINITDSYSDLGYTSEQEMLDLMKVIVFYETKANFLELVDNNDNVLSLNDVSCINGYGNHNHLINSSINKVSTGESSGYIGTSGLKLYATRPEGFFITEKTWSSYISPAHDSKLFGDKIPSNSPMIKFFDYLTQQNNRAYLQFVFKELKYDSDAGTWGDDNKFQITNKVSTVTDLNGNAVLYGQKAVNLPYFIGDN